MIAESHGQLPPIESRLPGADPQVFRFLEAWRAARKDGSVPYRVDFDPTGIPSLLKFVWLYRFDPDQGDFVCELAGEDVNTAWGQGIKGSRLRDIVGADDHATVLGRWKQIVGRPLVQYGKASERLSKQRIQRAERILAPMMSVDGQVDVVLGMSLYRIGPVDRERPALVPEDIIQIPCAEI